MRSCPQADLAARTRALLKVEDGCNNFCTYCIIPYARGRVRSMPLNAAVEQARGLAAEGYREIVINGIEISSWGWEWKNGSCLRQLLAALCEAVPGVRIRLGSLEPRTIDEAFCKTLSGYANLCPQFHLSLSIRLDTVLSGCTADTIRPGTSKASGCCGSISPAAPSRPT
ncbi:MAG: radical SAM protein [Acutalibacteraceae bacterium]